jgi:hypothetical protein
VQGGCSVCGVGVVYSGCSSEDAPPGASISHQRRCTGSRRSQLRYPSGHANGADPYTPPDGVHVASDNIVAAVVSKETSDAGRAVGVANGNPSGITAGADPYTPPNGVHVASDNIVAAVVSKETSDTVGWGAEKTGLIRYRHGLVRRNFLHDSWYDLTTTVGTGRDPRLHV